MALKHGQSFRTPWVWLSILLVVVVMLAIDCTEAPISRRSSQELSTSSVSVTVTPRERIIVKTPTVEFDVLSSGYIQAYLMKDGKRLTLDEPEQNAAGSSDFLLHAGNEIRDFVMDLNQVKVSDAQGKLGTRGKRIEVTGLSSKDAACRIEKRFALEVYENFPNLAFTTHAYKNVGSTEVKLDQVVFQSRRLSASLVDTKAPPYRLWSFQGSSYEWGKDEVVEITRTFHRPNILGVGLPNGNGGGIPMVAFWTGAVGEAIGHLEPLPLMLSLPVKVGADQRIHTSLMIEPKIVLRPGEVYSTPRSFVAVFSGDFYEPLRLYSMALQREEWTLPTTSNSDYSINWCGWGYESDVTPAQMLGTMPKLRALNVKWATLDYRWFGRFGDWVPRVDTFPAGSVKNMVDEFHKQGIRVQVWWFPLAAEDGLGKDFWGHPYKIAQVVKEHPDWLILDNKGKHARIFLNLAALCPALPQVQEHYRKVTERLIHDYGFDGSKLDMTFSVPPCYNPNHHHRSPEESIYALREVFKEIFETTRHLKPESITQICPCGTTPNIAWLPYMDQAVTADPVGGSQVRRRIKMYKALLGPQAAVYGDHVELSEMRRVGEDYIEVGTDFASTVGPGGVVGTKFTWPDYGPKFKRVYLTPQKEGHWKKWSDLYNSKMLSRGTFLNLYVYGYDAPEGYVIAKVGKMYYAFFSSQPLTPWKGEIDLRGLQPGRYRVFDYVNRRNLGILDAQNPKLKAEFTGNLLLEVDGL